MSSSSPKPAATTEFTARVSKFGGAVFVLFLLVSFVSSLWLFVSGKIEMLPPGLTFDGGLHGEVTHKIAKQLPETDVAQRAADLQRGASWLLLHDTGARVRPGCAGWLFLTDEMRINRHARANAESKVAAVRDIQQQLARRGISLLVAVVPDKSRIASAQLCNVRRPVQLQNRVEDWVAQLNGAGVQAVDLTLALQPLGAEAYLRTDTHWSEVGASAAAKAIALQVQAMGISATPHKEYESTAQGELRRPGDLVRLAGLEWLPLSLQPAAESVAASQTREKAGAASASASADADADADSLDDLFGDGNLPNVALIGTSFSRNSNFAGFLQKALGAPMGDFAKDGGEFSGGANSYFSNRAFTQTPPTLLIWEIPERDLQTPYSEVIKPL